MERENVGSESRPVETAVEARQGYLDRPVLVVLVVSIALVLAAFAVLLLPTMI